MLYCNVPFTIQYYTILHCVFYTLLSYTNFTRLSTTLNYDMLYTEEPLRFDPAGRRRDRVSSCIALRYTILHYLPRTILLFFTVLN